MKASNQQLWWVLRAQSGDKDAWDLLFESIQPALLRYIHGVVQNSAISEEILQETLVLIYRKIQWLEDPRLFRAWSYRIASRETWKRLKQERKHSQAHELDLNLQAAPANESDCDPGLRLRLPELLAGVSPASRSVLVLHYLEDMKLHEIADVLEISVGTVKSRLAYGLATLRKSIDRRNDHEK